MDFGKRRLLATIAQSMDRMAGRYGVPDSDMDHVAVTTAIAELLRREETDPIKAFYSEGYALALRLAEISQQEGVAPADSARLRRLPPSIAESAGFAPSQDLLVALKGVLSSLVSNSGYPSDPRASLENIISSLCRWEGDHHKFSLPPTAKAKDRYDVKQIVDFR